MVGTSKLTSGVSGPSSVRPRLVLSVSSLRAAEARNPDEAMQALTEVGSLQEFFREFLMKLSSDSGPRSSSQVVDSSPTGVPFPLLWDVCGHFIYTDVSPSLGRR